MNTNSIFRAAIAVTSIFMASAANAQIGSPVTINVTPVATVNGLVNKEYCSGSTAAAQAFTSSAGADSFQISGGATVGLANQTITTSSVPSFTASASSSSDITALITVTPFDNGCSGTASTYTVNIPATATATAPASQAVCAGSNVAATTFTGTNADSFVITGGGSGLSNATVTTANVPAYTATATGGTYTISITPYNNGCAGTMVSYTVNVTTAPSVDQPSNVTVCGNGSIAVTFTGTASSYAWSNSNTNIGLGASGTGNISGTAATVTAQQVGTITVTPSTGSCTGAAKTFSITVNTTPNGSLSAANTTICSGTQAQLTFTKSAGNPASIQYTINGGAIQTQAISSDPQIFNVTSSNASNSYQLMQITDANGCIKN